MKIIGAFFVFAAFCGFGILIWNEKKRAYETLAQLCFSLELTASELASRSSPLPELIKLLSERVGRRAAEFYKELYSTLPLLGDRDFSLLWTEAVKKTLGSLTAAEQEEFVRLGYILGRYELQEQISAVKTTLIFFIARRDSAQAKSVEEKKLSLGLTAAAGALLAIVLL